jgi:hypothetical protein
MHFPLKPFLFLAFLCLTISTSNLTSAHHNHHTQLTAAHLLHKSVNSECCMMLGGMLCGTTFPECCAGGCRSTWYGGTSCLGMKLNISHELCPNSCKNVCRAQGGIICGTTITTEECCPPQFCTGIVARSCSGIRIPLGNCVRHTSFSKWSWG